MQTQDIEQATRDFIRTFSNKEYVGKVKVIELQPQGYEVTIYPQGEYVPMVFYAELDDKAFLKFLKDEIRTKKFQFSEYGVLNKLEPDRFYPSKNICSCNDK